nr:unnamed protein product [Callosobruchus analis]
MYKSSIADLVSFDVTLAKDLPGNLGKYFRIKVTVETATETHTHHLFAKMIDESKEKIISDFSIFPFRKERFFIEIVLERLKELGVEELTNFCPKCNFARKDMLIFEDISVDGYNSWDYQIPVSYNWLATTIKLLAKLHASSIIFEEKVGDKLGRTVRLDEEYPDDVREAAFVANEAYKEYQDCNRRSIYGYLLSQQQRQPLYKSSLEHLPRCSRLWRCFVRLGASISLTHLFLIESRCFRECFGAHPHTFHFIFLFVLPRIQTVPLERKTLYEVLAVHVTIIHL